MKDHFNKMLIVMLVAFQLILYAGANTSAKKVAEYGGNVHGFGSRSVLGAGWPKDLVKVPILNASAIYLLAR